MRAKPGDEGKFGSIGTRDIAGKLTNSGLEVDRALKSNTVPSSDRRIQC
jgi:ribosomal protein L9